MEALQPVKSTSKNSKNKTGIVLLEVIIALTLFVVAAAVIGSATNSSMQATVDMQRSAHAVNIVRSILAEMEIGQVEIADKSETACEDDEDKGWTYTITTEDVADDAPGLKKVTVTVTDSDSFRPHTYHLTQWILDPNALAEQTGETTP
jgi:type II secretion system protein I